MLDIEDLPMNKSVYGCFHHYIPVALGSRLMGVPQDAGVVHHNYEGPHILSFDALLLLPVPLQLQVVVGQFLDHESSRS